MTEVFILVPALLGLKGNLEMTLASRLSTAVSAQGAQEGQGCLVWGALCVWAGKIPQIPRVDGSRPQRLGSAVLGRCFHPAGLMGFEGLMVLKLC